MAALVLNLFFQTRKLSRHPFGQIRLDPRQLILQNMIFLLAPLRGMDGRPPSGQTSGQQQKQRNQYHGEHPALPPPLRQLVFAHIAHPGAEVAEIALQIAQGRRQGKFRRRRGGRSGSRIAHRRLGRLGRGNLRTYAVAAHQLGFDFKSRFALIAQCGNLLQHRQRTLRKNPASADVFAVDVIAVTPQPIIDCGTRHAQFRSQSGDAVIFHFVGHKTIFFSSAIRRIAATSVCICRFRSASVAKQRSLRRYCSSSNLTRQP
ncbi:hypothetical protein SDC9_136022 [bioreactor metagenome]|uniref:Uncharacterized protein n=1 Tax=bioreactor metagenome TaxID=1076179 RepID=A0A645DIR9_9ZZZZ